MKTALTIAGSDPTGGAGLQSDLRVFQALGVHGYSLPTALTAQSTRGVEEIWPVGEVFMRRQLESLLGDLTPHALKTGMLYSVCAVRLTAEAVRKYRLENLVVDPISISSTGVSLVEDGMLEALKATLFPLARVVTPNIHEASLLAGMRVDSPEDMEEAAVVIRGMGTEAVVVTGGHLESLAVDVYHDAKGSRRLTGEKVPGEYHGTGCVFSAAVTALMARGLAPMEAVVRAKDFVLEAIRSAHHPGGGMGLLRL